MHKSDGLVILAIIVDDILIGYSCQRMYEHSLKFVKTCLDLDEGEISKYNELEVNYDREKG